jgi:Skp family chaperone for outer membrane proteins
MKRWLVLTGLFCSSLLPAQKLATVNLDSVIKCLPEFQTLQYKVDSLMHSMEKALKQLENDYYTRCNTGCHRKWTEEERTRMEQELIALQERIQEFLHAAQEQISSYQSNLFLPVKNKARVLCVMVSRQDGYALLIDNSAAGPLLYKEVDPVDITADVIARIK